MNIHNPDQHMMSLRQIIALGRKRIAFLVGAGAPAGILMPDGSPLIPITAELTRKVLAALNASYGPILDAIKADVENPNIENVLSRIRSLAAIIGTSQIHGLDGAGHKALAEAICAEIGKIVDQQLPEGSSPFAELVSWISGADRDHPIEIFTTNYDRLFEQALERARVPYFDGFVGANEPFFDPSSVANNDLPARWVRLWKLHGSLGWAANSRGEVIRQGGSGASHLIFPEHLKYEQTQKAPYAALFDRLRAFLRTPDTLLIVAGFSFADAHVSACLDECLAANASTSVFAFQYKSLTDEPLAASIARHRANMSVYSPNKAIVNGIEAVWLPGDPPTRDWGPIRAGYWGSEDNNPSAFLLGRFDRLARFFATCRADHSITESSSTAPLVQQAKGL